MPVATILISEADNTKVEMSLEGTLTPSIKELGKMGANANFHWESSGIMKYTPARDATPIIQLHKLTNGFWLWPPRLRVYGMERVEEPGSKEEWYLVPDNER